jgi:trehalose 6-phosphate phosphatase
VTDALSADALALARDALATSPAGLFADFDGTLSAIVRDPMAARLAPGAAEALTALGRRLAVVCIVTGRAAADVRRMSGLDDVWVAGNHGIEWLAPGESQVELPPELAGVPAELDRLLAAVPQLPGLWLEDKDLSATVHYRRSPEPAAAREHILEALRSALIASPAGVELREGRFAVELRPAGIGDKGTAVRALTEQFALCGIVVIGDDLTDLDMFRAAADLRAEGGTAAIIAVGSGGEASSRVAAAADTVVADPAAVVDLLAALAATTS